MIKLDTSKCPIELMYDRGWDYESSGDAAKGELVVSKLVRVAEKDIFKMSYKDNKLTIRSAPREIKFTGDLKEIAYALALLIEGTLGVMQTGLCNYTNGDIINEAFTFSEKGKINGCWIVEDNMKTVIEFIDVYNKVHETVILLKD